MQDMSTLHLRALAAFSLTASTLARPQWDGAPPQWGQPGETNAPWNPEESTGSPPVSIVWTTATEPMQIVDTTQWVTQIVTVGGGGGGGGPAPSAPFSNTQQWQPVTTAAALPETTPAEVTVATHRKPRNGGGGQPTPTSIQPPPTNPTPDSNSSSNSNSNSNSESGTSADSSLVAAVLNSTNWYRSQYEAAPLAWNNSLYEYGQSWASQCNFSHTGGLNGENLALGYPSVALGIDAWGDEEAEYDWSSPGFTPATGHFTQLVWKATTTVGCGWVDCTGQGVGALGWYLVCEYWPAGNMGEPNYNSYAVNVQKPGESANGQPGLSNRSLNSGTRSVAHAGAWALGLAVAVGLTLAV